MKFRLFLSLIFIFQHISLFSQNEPFLFPAKHDREGMSGFIDMKGKMQIPPYFDEVGEFYEGLAPVKLGDNWGYIDKKGKVVISAVFQKAFPFTSGVARVIYKDSLFFVNLGGGRFTVPLAEHGDFSDGLLIIKQNGKFGYANTSGKIIIQAVYEEAVPFSNQTAYGRIGETWYFFNTTGRILFKTNNRPFGHFSDGLIQVVSGNQYGFMDKSGNLIIPISLPFLNLSGNYFSESRAVFQEISGSQPIKTGCIDKSGRVVIPPLYESIGPFKNGLAVFKDENYGYLDKTGKIVYPAAYHYAYGFSEGFAIAVRKTDNENYQYELLDTRGQIIKTLKAPAKIPADARFKNGLCLLLQKSRPQQNINDENIHGHSGMKAIYINTKGDIVWESGIYPAFGQ
jgi:hypothetical protein